MLASVAPAEALILDRLERTTANAVEPGLLEHTRHAVRAVHGDGSSAAPASTPTEANEREGAALAFAEQFALDVSNLGAELRDAMVAALGADALAYAQAVYVLDVVGRGRAILDALFGPSSATPATLAAVEPFGDLWTGIEELLARVPGLSALDPVITEVVRLRLANHHHCRLCRSLRSYSALAAGISVDTLSGVAAGSTAGVDAASLAAMELVDAFAWTPYAVDGALTQRLRASYSDAQLVEMVLDTVRNASNKIAVAFGADAPHVTEGYEVYDVAVDGTITYGLSAPAAAS